ncbi:hypothetical protein GQ457_17G002530 [Hibiscus cannabinus]
MCSFHESGGYQDLAKSFFEANWTGKEVFVVQSDSQVNLNWISQPLLRPWKLWPLFEQIDNLAKSLSPVQFQLVSREMNYMANSLANLGIQRSETFKAWW